MCWKKGLIEDDGFSLIEVILAVAILALVTLPILNYYTYSSVRTIDGRDTQTATMAAENVIEELESYSNYKQIEELATATASPTSTPIWRLSNPSATMDPQHTEMERVLTLNGRDYLAKVNIDYTTYKDDTMTIAMASSTPAPMDPEFNDYAIPKPSEVYSDSNIVAVEDDEKDLAASDLYAQVNGATPVPAGAPASTPAPPGANMDAIMAAMFRTICIDVDYKPTPGDTPPYDDKIYTVHVYYEYGYGLHHTQVTLERLDIKKESLKSIFVFYKAMNMLGENFRINFDTKIDDEELEGLEIYLAVDDNSSKASNYKIRVTPSDVQDKVKVYANTDLTYGSPLSSAAPATSAAPAPSAAIPGATPRSFVKHERGKRIGRITVDIYEADEGTPPAPIGEVLAHMETTLAE